MAIKLIQITAYVRNEQDLALWKALPNKTEAIHQMLQQAAVQLTTDSGLEAQARNAQQASQLKAEGKR